MGPAEVLMPGLAVGGGPENLDLWIPVMGCGRARGLAAGGPERWLSVKKRVTLYVTSR